MKVPRTGWLICLISVAVLIPKNSYSGVREAVRESRNRLLEMVKELELSSQEANDNEPPDSAYRRRSRLDYFTHISDLPEPERFVTILEEDPSPAVRHMAIKVIGPYLNKEAVIHALDRSLSDEHPAVRAEAASVLLNGEYSEELCIETLIEIAAGVNMQNWSVSGFRVDADFSEDPGYRESLITSWRATAIRALSRTENPKAKMALQKLDKQGFNDRYLSALIDNAIK